MASQINTAPKSISSAATWPTASTSRLQSNRQPQRSALAQVAWASVGRYSHYTAAGLVRLAQAKTGPGRNQGILTGTGIHT